jgi:hypothetical protein
MKQGEAWCKQWHGASSGMVQAAAWNKQWHGANRGMEQKHKAERSMEKAEA